MTTTEKLNTQKGAVLLVEKRDSPHALEISIRFEEFKRCLLHWGIRRNAAQGSWQLPPESVWPEGSRAFDDSAVQTPFLKQDGIEEITIKLDRRPNFALIDFVLYFPDEGWWDNNSGNNYRIEIPETRESTLSPHQIIEEEIGRKKVVLKRVFQLDGGGELTASVTRDEQLFRITFVTDVPGPLLLHWGLSKRSRHDWSLPPPSAFPSGTIVFEGNAARTPFVEHRGLQRLDIEIDQQDAPAYLSFVLKKDDGGHWIKDRGRNFHLPVAVQPEHEVSLHDTTLTAMADQIIQNEMSRNSWTLMHRFNLCYDLLDKAGDDEENLALIYVWLRFSALRQLDWQRNYNTKPRELGHSMDRLSRKLSDSYAGRRKRRELVRLIMTTLGRGTDAQRVRDEVLHIMHRHHIKEVSGHFMEEWHQKLHNNTTPDDIVICEAFLQFLRNDGNLDKFYDTLEESGVTKERLESYERPIRSDPDFVPHLKEALIQDFEHFLGILREVHYGTDLGAAIQSARSHFDQEMHDLMDFIWSHRLGRDASVSALVEKVTRARRILSERLKKGTNGLRDLLFLDLALEEFLRVSIERTVGIQTDQEELARLIELVLENLTFDTREDEFLVCLYQWRRLLNEPHFKEKWSLQAKSVMDRLGRAIGVFTEEYLEILQPKAEFLGKAFEADPWTISLFSEEVVRGRLPFVLSLLLRYMEPVLRKIAHLGNWQLVSPGRAAGRVEVASTLMSLQGKGFSEATVVVADSITGNEEIPEGVTAVISSDPTDIVSHVAIRARNARILFATCFEQEEIDRLKSLRGKTIRLSVSAAHDVVYEETNDISQPFPQRLTTALKTGAFKTVSSAYAISANEFNERVVGGKANNLRRLKRKLPKWIGLPASVALPFGVFERVLAAEKNRRVSERYEDLCKQIEQIEGDRKIQLLSELRNVVLDLAPPEELISSLQSVMNTAGLLSPESWENVWLDIKHVWASKWNDRAFLSRAANGIPHERLVMSVLVQEVVEADYAFVIHTVNPFSGERDQVYAEVVLGLGETLVGNYPGRALSFTCKKGEHKPQVLAFPSKSFALYGAGLIFRSDSNGEDLASYAGAGLYDSIMDPPPRKTRLDYSKELMLWNEHFRKNFMVTIALIGTMIEEVMGSPQDIEGAYCRGQYHVLQTRPQVGIE